MTPLVREWMQKAEGDYEVMLRLVRIRRRPAILDSVCFHAQQCAEKYLKAVLQQAGQPVPRTHDLTKLLDLVLPLEPMLEQFRPPLSSLTRYAVTFRYPGNFATREETLKSVADCKKIRLALRETLGFGSQTKLRKQSRKKR